MNDSNKPPSNRKVIFWLIVTTILWGGSYVFNKIGFREVPPVTFMFIRFSIATVLMALFFFRRLPGTNSIILKKGGMVGLALCAANLSFVLGISDTTVSRAGYLNNLFVLIVPLLCFIIWNDRIDIWNIGGVLIAVFGLWQLARGSTEGFNRGDLLSTVCAFFLSLQIILVSKILKDEDVYLVSLVQFAVVAVIGGLLCIIFPQKPFKIGIVSAIALIYCAVFPTLVCFTLQNIYQRYTTATQAGLIYTLDPVWSMLGGIIFLGERLSRQEWIGCILILAAVALPFVAGHFKEQKKEIELLKRVEK